MADRTLQIDDLRRILSAYEARMIASLAHAPEDVRASLRATFATAPSSTQLEAVRALESELPGSLPQGFVAYLQSFDHSGIEHNEFTLPAMGGPDGLRRVRQLLLNRDLWRLGLIQFAQGASGDPVCFDLTRRGADGEYQVVVAKHDLAPRAAWASRDQISPFLRDVAPSFPAFIRAVLE